MEQRDLRSALRVTVGGTERRFEADEIVTIGRDHSVPVPVPGDAVSRRHAQVRWGPTGWELLDLDSTNGTYVGGRRVTAYPVASGLDATLGPPDRGVSVRIEPVTSPGGGRMAAGGDGALTTKLLLLVGGVATIGVGLFLLDWVNYRVTIQGTLEGLGDSLNVEQGAGVDFDEGKISTIVGAITGLIGVLGLRTRLSQRLVGAMLVLGALIIAAVTLYFMANVGDQAVTVPGFTANVEASLAAGGPVTLVGAALLGAAGLLFAVGGEGARTPHQMPRIASNPTVSPG